MSKLIHSDSWKNLLEKLNIYEDKWSEDGRLQKALIFTDDGYLATHGKRFKLTEMADDAGNSYLTNFNRNGLQLNITVSGEIASLQLPSIDGDDKIEVTAPVENGNFTIQHATAGNNSYTLQPSLTNGKLSLPHIGFDKWGHHTNTLSSKLEVDVDKTNQESNALTDSTYYLWFGKGNGSQYANYNENIKVTSSGLYAPTFYENNKALANIYAKKDTYANASTYGLVKLSDSTEDGNTGTGGTIAATPKAVYDALAAAKKHADNLVGSLNGALVYKGLISSQDDVTNAQNKAAVGHTYRVNTADTYTINGSNVKLEVGDLLIVQKVSETSVTWTVAQTNLDGAVTTKKTLTAGQLLVGNGSHDIKPFAGALTTGQVLTWGTQGLEWKDAWRSITVGTTSINNNVSLTLKGENGVNVTATADGNITITGTTYTIATATKAGLVKPASVISKPTLQTISDNSNRYYSVEMDTTGNMFVNVPWANTTYSAPTDGGLVLDGTAFKANLKQYTKADREISDNNKLYAVRLDKNGYLSVKVPWKNTTYEAGTGLSLDGTTFSLTAAGTSLGGVKNGDQDYANNAGWLQSPINNGIVYYKDTNTWRNVKALKLDNLNDSDTKNNGVQEILQTTIGAEALTFGESFAYDNGELELVWMEVTSSGITYAV